MAATLSPKENDIVHEGFARLGASYQAFELPPEHGGHEAAFHTTNGDSSLPYSLESSYWDTVPIDNALPNPLGWAFENSGYELRAGPRINSESAYCTWLDQDKTGTYDPEGKVDPGLRPPAEIFECRKRERPDRLDDDPDRPKIPRIYTWQSGRHLGKRLPVTLSFNSEAGKATLKAYGSSLDNWPKSAYRPLDQEIDWASWWNSGLNNAGDKSSPDSHGTIGDRKRRRSRPKYDDDEAFQSLEDLTLGHPAARGCKGCVALRQRCPLLDEGSHYPCEICVEDDIDCELVIEPVKKRACLNCGKKRICCSYREIESDHSLPCQSCCSKGLRCIAGPVSGRTRTGPALDSVSHDKARLSIVGPFASCTQCRKAKKRCSLKSKHRPINAACRACLDSGETCTFEPIERTVARAKCMKRVLDQAQSLTNARPEPRGNGSQYIRTKLAHPIHINYVGDQQCHWCEDISYGILGLAEVEVEVIDFDDGQGYLELEGGHVRAGQDKSRICEDCTFDRLMIAACFEHDIRQIDGTDPEHFDYESITDWLMPSMASNAPFEWCSVCPAPAFFSCCKDLDMEMMLKEDTDAFEENGRQRGCGLKLCEACATRLVNDAGGALETLARMIKEHDVGGFGLRADVDFILPGGELLRRIGSG